MWKYSIGKAFGIILTTIGLIFFIAMIANMLAEKGEFVNNLLGGVAIGVIPALLGFWIWYSSRKASRKYLMNRHEREILNAAHQNGGHLTPTELAMKTDLTLRESKKVLETMQLEGYAELKISSQGAINFYFRELDKKSSLDKGELLT